MYFNVHHKGSINEIRNHHNYMLSTKEQKNWTAVGTDSHDDAQAEALTMPFAAFRSTVNGFSRNDQ